MTVSLHYICEVNERSLDVENLHHFLINRTHHHGVGIEQAADGSHGDGPVEQPAAHEDAAPGEDVFLLEADFDEMLVLVGLVVVGLRQLLDFTVDPESATHGFQALQTCGGARYRADEHVPTVGSTIQRNSSIMS